MRDPARALKVVLVMALATLLSISLGTWVVVKRGRRRGPWTRTTSGG